MSAKIIGQNHSVITYELNGRKRFIVDEIESTTNRTLVNEAVEQVGREWSAVYNYIDSWLSNQDGGLTLADDSALCNCIDRMTY